MYILCGYHGTRSNFEIGGKEGGGGGTVSDSILGGARDFFLLTFYNFKNIGKGGSRAPSAPLLRSPWIYKKNLHADKLAAAGRVNVPFIAIRLSLENTVLVWTVENGGSSTIEDGTHDLTYIKQDLT